VKPYKVERINSILGAEVIINGDKKVMATIYDPIVSSDIVNCSNASTADLNETRGVDGDLLKVMSGYNKD